MSVAGCESEVTGINDKEFRLLSVQQQLLEACHREQIQYLLAMTGLEELLGSVLPRHAPGAKMRERDDQSQTTVITPATPGHHI